MATTTAAVTLSSDLMQDTLSVSTETTLMKAGTTADGLDQVRMGYNKVPTGTSFDLLDATAAGADKAAKVLISNDSTDETYYVTIVIDAKEIGRLYAGDWMWMPWSPKAQHVNDIEITPSVATGMHVEFMAIHDYTNIYPDSADS